MPHRAYFDNNATTPLTRYPSVMRVLNHALVNAWGNPSTSYVEGQDARRMLQQSRERVAQELGTTSESIYFTGSGTESNNIAIRTVMMYQHRAHGRGLVVTSAVEHSSVRNTARSCGLSHVEVPVDVHGRVYPDVLRNILERNRRNVGMVSIIYGQNEIGTIQDIPALVQVTREVLGGDVPFHTDATQMLGRYTVRPRELGVDLLTGSAHKFNGPRGVGILYARPNSLRPQFSPQTGGGQEQGVRCGTENVPCIAGAAQALRESLGTLDSLAAKQRAVMLMRERLRTEITRMCPASRVNGHPRDTMYNTLNITFPGHDGPLLADKLNTLGYAVGSGSACNKSRPSRVLMATGMPEADARATLRISLSDANTPSECAGLVRALVGVLPDCRVTTARP